MAININQNTINRAGAPRRESVRRDDPRKNKSIEEFAPPRLRAEENFVPSEESLATLVRSAVKALRNGVFWDRGTILNITV